MEKSEKEEELEVLLEEKGPEDDQLDPEKVSRDSKEQSVDHDVVATTKSGEEEMKELVKEIVESTMSLEENEDDEVKGETLKPGTPASSRQSPEIEEKERGGVKEEEEEQKKEKQEEEIKEDKEGEKEEQGVVKEEEKEDKKEEEKMKEEKEVVKEGEKKVVKEEKEDEKEKEEKGVVKEEEIEFGKEEKEREKEKKGVTKEEEKEDEKEKDGGKGMIEEKVVVKEEKEGEKEEKKGEKEEKKGEKEEKEGEKEEKEEEIKEERGVKEEEKSIKVGVKGEKEGEKEEKEGEIQVKEEDIEGEKEGEKGKEEEKGEVRKMSLKEDKNQVISQEEKSEEKPQRIPTPPELNEMENFGQEENPKLMPNSALNIGWSFSFNQNIPVWNLTDNKRNLIMYTSSHTGIIYDYQNNTQSILQGHANSISCTSLSDDKKWLVTADKGKDSTVIIWNTYTCFPVRTLFNVNPNGMEAIALTPDAKYLATMSAEDVQEFSIWDWTVSEDKPLASVTLKQQFSGRQNYICFCEENVNYIVTNSENQVIFYQWKDESLKYFAPSLTDQDFHIQIGKYSQSIIIADTIHALTATSVGNLVVWDTNISMGEGKKRRIANKKASKIIKLIPCGITFLALQDTHIVTGDVCGNVSFFDQRMTLLHCFNNLGFGPIKSLSFSRLNERKYQNKDQYPQTCTLNAERIILPDFIVSSSIAQCALIKVEKPEIQVLIRDHGKTIPAIATHPYKPFLATGSYAGFLKVYDYIEKVSISSCTFEKEMIESCAFSPDGCHLAVGFVSGVIQVLDSFTLKAEPSDIHRYSKQAIIQVVFSDDSNYLAAADMGFVTSLLKKDTSSSFIFLGRYKAHYKPIRQLMFGEKFNADEPRLLSLGEDRMLVEYDLAASSVDNVRILSIERIEQSATPRCMAWHPPLNKEHFIVTANDQYKYKLYNSTTMMCRKTVLAPIYEYPIAKLIVLPTEGVDPKHLYMTFITQDKVGLQILPFDGNPHQSTALIAHPGGVHNLVVSYDGAFLFTTSSQEPSVHMWCINPSALEAQLRLGGEDLIPFYQLLEGGREGPFFEELKEYFYFCQLRSSDINSMSTREVSKMIPVKEIPYLMRALGFYPSEQELADMVNEIKYSEYVDNGEFKEEINLPDFLKLYINHRPYRNLMSEKLKWAFNVLGKWDQKSEESCLPTTEMLNLIQSQGEHITSEELDEILMDLCLLELDCSNELGNRKDGDKIKDFSHLANFIDSKLPEVMTAPAFVNNLLALPENIFKT